MTSAVAPSATPSQHRPLPRLDGVVAVSVDARSGPLYESVFDHVSMVMPPTKWNYGNTQLTADHRTIDQTWDGPTPAPVHPGNWRFAANDVPPAAKASADRLLNAVQDGRLRSVPVDSTWKGIGDGDVMVTLWLRDAQAAFPGQRTWDDGSVAPGTRSVNWTVRERDAAVPIRDVVTAARELQASLGGARRA